MPKNSFLQALFQGPKFSVAPIEQNNRGSLKIGQIVPVYSTVLNPREGVQLDLAHLVRFMPAKAPVMEGYKVTFDAFAVPFSTLGYAERYERNIDDFFNIKENGGEISNPFCFDMMNDLSVMFNYGAPSEGSFSPSLANMFRKGSLGDYINFPSLKSVREHVRKWLDINNFVSFGREPFIVVTGSPTDDFNVVRFVATALVNDDNPSSLFAVSVGDASNYYRMYLWIPFSTASEPVITSTTVSGSTIFASATAGSYSRVEVRTLLGYILKNYPAVASYYKFPTSFGSSSDNYQTAVGQWVGVLSRGDFNFDFLQVLYDIYKIDAQSIYDEYFEYVMRQLLYKSTIKNSDNLTLYDTSVAFLPVLGEDDPVDLSFLAAYWKIISDWYINTNIDGDPEDFFLRHCRILGNYTDTYGRYVDMKPFVRRWANDIFTSAVPEAAVQNVRIPADGTIPDLREANAYQKLVDIFRNTGRRLRDVVYGIFGITPSAVRSEMSEPIGTQSTWIGMQSILQTSQTTEKSPLAAYAGIGTDSKGHSRLCKFVNNDEPTPVIIMVLMSITQRASYMQGFDKKFFRKSIYDFAVPQLAMIGEEEVTNKEVYFDKNYSDGVFGFNRRYYSWFYSGSEVHGDLRDSEDYWHGARIFDEQPNLNREFIGIEPETDHLQRVFANTSESAAPIRYNISFDGYKTVALPRYIQYEL